MALKFLWLLTLAVIGVIVVVVWAVNKPSEEDSSEVIAFGVLFAAGMALLFYLWLCVVSHFQVAFKTEPDIRFLSKFGKNYPNRVKKDILPISISCQKKTNNLKPLLLKKNY